MLGVPIHGCIHRSWLCPPLMVVSTDSWLCPPTHGCVHRSWLCPPTHSCVHRLMVVPTDSWLCPPTHSTSHNYSKLFFHSAVAQNSLPRHKKWRFIVLTISHLCQTRCVPSLCLYSVTLSIALQDALNYVQCRLYLILSPRQSNLCRYITIRNSTSTHIFTIPDFWKAVSSLK